MLIWCFVFFIVSDLIIALCCLLNFTIKNWTTFCLIFIYLLFLTLSIVFFFNVVSTLNWHAIHRQTCFYKNLIMNNFKKMKLNWFNDSFASINVNIYNFSESSIFKKCFAMINNNNFFSLIFFVCDSIVNFHYINFRRIIFIKLACKRTCKSKC